MNNRVQEDTIKQWVEILARKQIPLTDLKIACQEVIFNDEFLTLAKISKYLPQTNIVPILKEAIHKFGFDNRLYLNDNITSRDRAIEFVEINHGSSVAQMLREYGSQLAMSEPFSTNQKFLEKEINEYYNEQKEHLEKKYIENKEHLKIEEGDK